MVIVLTPDGKPDTTWGPKGYRLYDLGGQRGLLLVGGALSGQEDDRESPVSPGPPAAGGSTTTP